MAVGDGAGDGEDHDGEAGGAGRVMGLHGGNRGHRLCALVRAATTVVLHLISSLPLPDLPLDALLVHAADGMGHLRALPLQNLGYHHDLLLPRLQSF